MFIELTDHLRCPADHDESFLVLLPLDLAGRDVVQGTLGCPVCQREYAIVRQSLIETGFDSGVGLFSTFAGRAADLKGYLADAQVNRDRNLRLQYLAGFSLNQYDQAKIYSNVLASGHWVDGMFTGSPDKVAYLRSKVAVR